MSQTWHERHTTSRSFSQKLADWVALGMGSWKFIIIQSIIVLIWIVMNIIGWISHWDPYPFILLNLLFSTQAAYAAPIIMMSQNRQNQRDRYHAQADYETNITAKVDIEQLQKTLAHIETDKLDKILEILKAK